MGLEIGIHICCASSLRKTQSVTWKDYPGGGGVTWLPPSLRSLARCGVRMIPAIAIGGAGEVLEEHDDGAQQAAGQGGGHGWAKRPLWTAMNL